MSTDSLVSANATSMSRSAPPRASRLLPALIVFLSAWLLFSVEPLIGKYTLPWFGGGANVWIICVACFQVLLVVGYGYAHLLTTWLPRRIQLVVHLLVLGACAACLPIIPADHWKPAPGAIPETSIGLMLLVVIGAPFVALSATASLLQSWQATSSRTTSSHHLYAISNAGSLAALLMYPTLIEPLVPRRIQAIAWSISFGIFATVCLLYAVRTWKFPGVRQSRDATACDKPRTSPLSVLPWLALPLLGSVLLLAYTNKLAQDVAALPFLWILPLAIYLLSFIVTFAQKSIYRRGPWYIALTIMYLCTALALSYQGRVPLVVPVVVHVLTLFVTCVICHGELANRRPGPSQLTLYYFCISLGGAIGGLLVALGAPYVLNGFHEFPGGLVLCALVPVILGAPPSARKPSSSSRLAQAAFSLVLSAVVVTATIFGGRPKGVCLDQTRSFYGVLRVFQCNEPGESPYRTFMHGSIAHGMQLNEHPRVQTMYYGSQSGAETAFRLLGNRSHLRIGIVGLGVGTIASYARPGDTFRFYEIDSKVTDIAQNYFTYLKDCEATASVSTGDARLVLENEPPQDYDLLILDAFSGDSIPTHLLTDEAFDVYQRHLRSDGIIAIHITNRYIDLWRPIIGASLHRGFTIADVALESNVSPTGFASSWALLFRDQRYLQHPAIQSSIVDTTTGSPDDRWTDERASVFPLVRWWQ